MKSQEIRTQFFQFFQSKKHEIVPSAPLVLKDDPTLMFVNAGMVPFKEYFLGNATPKNNRLADSQKCLRVSGKHNDLEEVGYDTYHHTLFEMLGNWSFGDYFKKEAIEWAWEFLTDVLKIDKESLYVSVFEGSKEDGTSLDQEAFDIWKNLVPENRILLGNKKDNFWEMGDQGPCGPCSEIHVDIRSAEEKAKIPGRDLVNQDHPQVVEIWNLVFMQYNRKANGSLEELPAKHIDTGMGFERLCMVMQGKQSNYDTDVFTPIIREVENLSGKDYGTDPKTDVAIRVVADHLRAVAFSIADGQLPGNTGAGYVIRRILRRAIRYGFTFLGQKEPFIYRLVSVLSRQMGDTFPEIKSQKQLVENVIREEEQSFLRTLDQGLTLLDGIVKSTSGDTVSGEKAFELYDTYGFPIDLTALILNEKGKKLDAEGFQKELQKQKDRSKKASENTTGDWVTLIEDDIQEFVGYDMLETPVKIVRYRKVSSKKEGDRYQLVFNLTPFYPEGGGQVGDKGSLSPNPSPKEKGANPSFKKVSKAIKILDTKRENNVIVHIVEKLPDNLDGEFSAKVDTKLRVNTARNHTATHLLHQALREILGTHVEQKGSAVHSKYLRFDFSHFSKLTDDELKEIEHFVNARIEGALPLKENRNIPVQQALEQGAIALFGEKYGDTVRTIRFGQSIELCGGTHVANTSDIWHFKIVSEGAVASGIRRIEAITGDAVRDFFYEKQLQAEAVKALLNNAQDPIKAVNTLQEENAQLKKQLETLLKEKAGNLKNNLKNELREMNGLRFLAKKIDLNMAGIKDISFQLGSEYDNLFLLFGAEQNGKAMLSCYISKPVVESHGLNAGKIIRDLGQYIQGGGGGQPFFATAGGRKPEGIAEALEKAEAYVLD